MWFKLRYHLVDAVTDAAVLAWCASYAPHHLVVCHQADVDDDRVHWHAFLDTPHKMEAVRLALKRAVPTLVSGGYSLGTVKATAEDRATYVRYMCHAAGRGAVVDIVAASGLEYTREWAQSQNEAFYAAQDEFRARLKKKGKQSTVVELLEECTAAQTRTRLEVCRVIVKMFNRQRRPMIESYMKAVVTSVCVALELEVASSDLVERLNFISQY